MMRRCGPTPLMNITKELEELDKALKATKRLKEIMNTRAKIAERRQQLFMESWNTKLAEEERDMKMREQVLAMRQKEELLDQQWEETGH